MAQTHTLNTHRNITYTIITTKTTTSPIKNVYLANDQHKIQFIQTGQSQSIARVVECVCLCRLEIPEKREIERERKKYKKYNCRGEA